MRRPSKRFSFRGPSSYDEKHILSKQIRTASDKVKVTKQFIIGELSKADLKLLQDGAKPSSGNEGHHH